MKEAWFWLDNIWFPTLFFLQTRPCYRLDLCHFGGKIRTGSYFMKEFINICSIIMNLPIFWKLFIWCLHGFFKVTTNLKKSPISIGQTYISGWSGREHQFSSSTCAWIRGTPPSLQLSRGCWNCRGGGGFPVWEWETSAPNSLFKLSWKKQKTKTWSVLSANPNIYLVTCELFRCLWSILFAKGIPQQKNAGLPCHTLTSFGKAARGLWAWTERATWTIPRALTQISLPQT